MQSIGVTVRLKRRWSTAGDNPARELDRSTWEQSERRWRQLGAKFPGPTRHVEPGLVQLVRDRQTKGPGTDRLAPKPPRHISTLQCKRLIRPTISFRHWLAGFSLHGSLFLEHPSNARLPRSAPGFFVFHHFEFQVTSASTRRSLP